MESSTPAHRHTNRLAQESSPYLLQHAHNPVDWHPWGAEAFEAARKQNRPIFLSVGYSTCYWCHVMERQCFEDPQIAAEMNSRFINVKVDREERPDVDQLYMTAVQVLTRSGGWPMSVFLTPDLRPFFGGTYFPPTDMHGRPGFVTVLRGIETAYHKRPDDVEKTATQLVNILQQYAQPAAPQEVIRLDAEFIDEMAARLTSDYDARHGGFGGAPKFPRETVVEFLLEYLAWPQASSARRKKIEPMVMHTLDAMADGGIRDQLGGGFHRYSTDAEWLVPHFEIMLYDNAMLAWCYAEAHRQTRKPRYAEVARGICDFVLREMTAPSGAFYTAFDAEVDSREGLNYLWTADEIQELLGAEDAKIFNCVYGVDGGPNFADPHHGTGAPDHNILFLPRSIADSAKRLKIDATALEPRLAAMRQTLYVARQKRKQPLLDTKIITSWAALMIRGLARAGAVLGESRYIDAAKSCAEFLLRDHRSPNGGLYRTSRDGAAKYAGFLDDYAFLAQALLELYAATNDPIWKSRAVEVYGEMNRRFGDADFGGWFFTEQGAPDLIVRQKTATDSPLPSGNGVAALVSIALTRGGDLSDDAALRPISLARQSVAAFSQQLQMQGDGMGAMVLAAMRCIELVGEFSVSADMTDPDRPQSPNETASKIVSAELDWKSPAELRVILDIREGFHIHSSDVAAPYVATKLNVSEAAEVRYPAAQTMTASFEASELLGYAGRIEIEVKFAKPVIGRPVGLNLTYQACDEKACLPPVTTRLDPAT